jgi:hypothetical protein
MGIENPDTDRDDHGFSHYLKKFTLFYRFKKMPWNFFSLAYKRYARKRPTVDAHTASGFPGVNKSLDFALRIEYSTLNANALSSYLFFFLSQSFRAVTVGAIFWMFRRSCRSSCCRNPR